MEENNREAMRLWDSFWRWKFRDSAHRAPKTVEAA